MSASREKNKRKEQAAVPETANNAKKGMSKGLKTTLIAVCTVLVVCIVVFFYMLTSGFFASHTTAATVSGHNLSPAMVNYFYKNAYSTMQEQYGDFMSYILDTNSPLDEQTYDADTGETWADFFTQQGLTTAAEVYAIADEAKANGYTLSEEEQAAIESQLTSLDLYAAYSNMNRNSYIAAVYGTGCSEKSFREYLEVTTLASSYAQSINSGFTYTDAEIAAEYEANPNSYDAVTYRQFLVSDSLFQTSTDSSDESTADSSDTTEELSEEELTALKEEMASTMAADDTMPTFTAAGRMSSNTTSICWATNAGSTSRTPKTPVVFCAVSAVTAVSANRPSAAIVLMSAWMPAPPLESDPAMLSTASMDAMVPPSVRRGSAPRRWSRRRPRNTSPCRQAPPPGRPPGRWPWRLPPR